MVEVGRELNEYLPEVQKKINHKISIQNGHFLHAKSISFSHPKTNEKVTFNAEPSEVFNKLLNMIENEEI